MASSHYLNQCWLPFSRGLWHLPNINFTVNVSRYNLLKWVKSSNGPYGYHQWWRLLNYVNASTLFSTIFPCHDIIMFSQRENSIIIWCADTISQLNKIQIYAYAMKQIISYYFCKRKLIYFVLWISLWKIAYRIDTHWLVFTQFISPQQSDLNFVNSIFKCILLKICCWFYLKFGLYLSLGRYGIYQVDIDILLMISQHWVR